MIEIRLILCLLVVDRIITTVKSECEIEVTTGYALYGHNDRTLMDTTLDNCKASCLEMEDCLSLDYNTNTKACFLSTDSKDTASTYYRRHPNVFYGHKMCEGEEVTGSGAAIFDGCTIKYGPYGHTGGSAFSDTGYITSGRITAIRIRARAYLTCLGLNYGDREGPCHGRSSGGSDPTYYVHLYQNEYIKDIIGRKGQHLDQISFITNRRTLGPYGGSGGEVFTIRSNDRKLAYISGRSGTLVDQLTFHFYC